MKNYKEESRSQGFGAAFQDGDLESNAEEVWRQQWEKHLSMRIKGNLGKESHYIASFMSFEVRRFAIFFLTRRHTDGPVLQFFAREIYYSNFKEVSVKYCEYT